jgi:hypothetical protein
LTIPAENLGIGVGFSEVAQHGIASAVEKILNLRPRC